MGEAETNEIAKILELYLQGNRKGYDRMVSYLQDPNLQDEVLIRCLTYLKDCVSLLSKDFDQLIFIILKINWPHRRAKAVAEFQSFIVNLISAHTVYLPPCLKMIVRWFMPDAKNDQLTKAQHETSFEYLHELLQAILEIAPLTDKFLLLQITACYPHYSKDAYIQLCYVQNLLRLCDYVPLDNRVNILACIVEHMIQLDVRASREDIKESEDPNDEDLIFVMDCDNDSDDDEEGSDDDEEKDVKAKPSQVEEGAPMTHVEGDKLDGQMELVLKFLYAKSHHKDGSLDWDTTKKLYKELLCIFDKLILPTHASCHIQFIIFYIISFDRRLAEGFLDYLWKKVSDPSAQTIYRQASAAYIGSLLARAKFLDVVTRLACLEVMSHWVHQYMERTAETGSQADLLHHAHFYSVCQTLFYAVAFKLKSLLAMPDGYQRVSSLKLQSIVTSRLNPLKFCLPVVSRTFCTLMRVHQLCYCDSILERNRRNYIPEEPTGSVTSRLTKKNFLDTFFPFDPYLLRRSCRFIIPLYEEYEGTPPEEGDHSVAQKMLRSKARSGAVSSDVLDERELHLYDSEVQDMADGKSATDLLLYSISPGFKRNYFTPE